MNERYRLAICWQLDKTTVSRTSYTIRTSKSVKEWFFVFSKSENFEFQFVLFYSKQKISLHYTAGICKVSHREFWELIILPTIDSFNTFEHREKRNPKRGQTPNSYNIEIIQRKKMNGILKHSEYNKILKKNIKPFDVCTSYVIAERTSIYYIYASINPIRYYNMHLNYFPLCYKL